MARALSAHRRGVLLATLLAASSAAAQTADGGTPPPASPPHAPAPAPAPAPPSEAEELRRDLESARRELKELRDEMRAQMATQAAAQGWQEEWVEEERKLELFVPDGYFRVRPELFHRFDLGRGPDPSGYTLWPTSPASAAERTQAGVNMRFRFEPTFNISEEVRIRMQLDALDNVLFGSTPDYAFSRQALIGNRYDRNEFTIFSERQEPPTSMINAARDSIALKRVYGEVSTPVGILRFGRMGSHWGLGMLRNDGNCEDCDLGDTVDRLMFVTEPLTGFYVTPMLDFDAEGPSSNRDVSGGAPFDLSNSDDAHSFILAVARRDTAQQARAKLENNLHVLNYGLHFTYRVQKNDPAGYYGQEFEQEGGNTQDLENAYVTRNAVLYIPDVWLRYERRLFRLELELAAVAGNIGLGDERVLNVLQLGGVAQGEYRFMDGALKLQLEVGFASGDSAHGFGNYPRRRPGGADGATLRGDLDGPQYACGPTACTDNSIRNFRFNRDYRVDMILWRELLGGVTDAIYAKPTLEYRVAEGFNIYGSAIYSRAVFASSTPFGEDPSLGIELNAGARYETEDGFFATAAWGILFPLDGLKPPRVGEEQVSLDNAQVLRGTFGVRF